MAATTYATIRKNTQATVHTIISSDSTISTQAIKVVDGVPRDLLKNRATYISINSPTVRHDNWVLDNSKFNCDISVPIVVSSRKESVAREIADTVINALKTNQNTTRGVKLYTFRLKGENTNQITLDSNDTVYVHNITVGYNYQG